MTADVDQFCCMLTHVVRKTGVHPFFGVWARGPGSHGPRAHNNVIIINTQTSYIFNDFRPCTDRHHG